METALSIVGVGVSVGAFALKKGGLRWKNRTFYTIAKFILTKIFNEKKDIEKVIELKKILIDKFNSKSTKELKTFLVDLKEIEALQKQYNRDDFFEKYKHKIVSDVENIKEYFNKKILIDEFCVFVFSNIYEVKVDDNYYREFKYSLLEDFALSENISALKLSNIFTNIYMKSNERNLLKYELLNKKFNENTKELKDVIDELKSKITTRQKHKGRGLMMIKENLNMLSFGKDMFEVMPNKRVSFKTEEGSETTSKTSNFNMSDDTIKTIKRTTSLSLKLAENVNLF